MTFRTALSALRVRHLTNAGNPSNYINLACYSFPVPATLLGNAGRNSLVGPGLAELDYSVNRNFPVPIHF